VYACVRGVQNASIEFVINVSGVAVVNRARSCAAIDIGIVYLISIIK